MDFIKYLKFALMILFLISCQSKKTQKENIEKKVTAENLKIELDLVKSIWASNGIHGLQGDSLIFVSEKHVRYYMGEISWDFDSDYRISNDTLTIKTITAAFEMNDVSGLKPDLIQNYVITKDSLILISLKNKIWDKWEYADIDRINKIPNYYRLK